MSETFISFYLSDGRIHVPLEALRGLGNPQYIHFLLAEDGKSMILKPCGRKVFSSMRVPANLYLKKDRHQKMDVNCIMLCRLLAEHLCWNMDHSYRAPGKIMEQQRLVLYRLDDAKRISNGKIGSAKSSAPL